MRGVRLDGSLGRRLGKVGRRRNGTDGAFAHVVSVSTSRQAFISRHLYGKSIVRKSMTEDAFPLEESSVYHEVFRCSAMMR